MKKYLNIECVGKRIPGFVNINVNDGGATNISLSKGLPFDNNSLDGIFSEHFIECLTQAVGARFFRECRRTLKAGGRLRIVTTDLDPIVKRYFSGDWRKKDENAFLHNPAEQLNLAMRGGGRCWLYNAEELVRLAEDAGLSCIGRCEPGASRDDELKGRERGEGEPLIYEFVKPRRSPARENPLVSVLITAYKPEHFREALESALGQTYRNIEILICDDSPDENIEKIVSEYSPHDPRIRYVRNENTLGGRGNYIKTFDLSRGEYIKYLNDDDLLHPDCVSRMLQCLKDFPEVTLVTSYRQLIGPGGERLPDEFFNRRIVEQDSLIDGESLVNYVLGELTNLIGEPTTVMFRKSDLEGTKPNIFSYAGRPAYSSGDITIWVNLLSKGDGIYLYDALSSFRLHAGQYQRQEDSHIEGGKGVEQLCFDARRMGFVFPAASKELKTRPLS